MNSESRLASSMKKLVKSNLVWPGHVEMMGDKKQEETRCPKRGDEKEARKTEIAMGVA